MPKRRRRPPTYTLHAPSGQARVRIDGKDHYLGPHDSPESHDRYDKLIAKWHVSQAGQSGRFSLTVGELCLLYLEHAQTYYRHKDGSPTSEIDAIKTPLRFLIELRRRCRVREFGPLKLEEVRQAMIDAGLCRTSINRQVHRIRRVFKWGVAKQIVPAEVHLALGALEALKAGRTKAHESPPVRPVDVGTVTNTLPFLCRIVGDMVRLQLLTGMRPGEVCALRPCDVSFGVNGQVWIYRPAHHKTEHHGKERRIYIGPQGQKILGPYLDRDPEACCFSPIEADAERKMQLRQNRRSPMTPSQAARQRKTRKLHVRYTKDSYNRAIRRACEFAFEMPAELRDVRYTVMRKDKLSDSERKNFRKKLNAEAAEWRRKYCWSPNQLRHTRATEIREKYGIEAAQTVLGHSDPRVTEIYAERDFAMAADIMQQVG